MNIEIQTSQSPESNLIEVPVHIKTALAEAAETAKILVDTQVEEHETETIAVARSINDARPEGISPTLPDNSSKPAYTELTASTVRSKMPTFLTRTVEEAELLR